MSSPKYDPRDTRADVPAGLTTAGPRTELQNTAAMCWEQDRSLTVMLNGILQKRTLPGLAILSPEGDVLFSNTVAKDILNPDADGSKRQDLLAIRNGLLAFHRAGASAAVSPGGPTSNFTTQSLVKWDRMRYAILGFWLHAGVDGHAPLLGALIEQITTDRIDISKAESLYALSRRETEVIRSLALGMTDKMIAVALGVSPETVRWYLKGIRIKLGVSTRTAILRKILSS